MTEDEQRGLALSVAEDIVWKHVKRTERLIEARPNYSAASAIRNDWSELRREIADAISRFHEIARRVSPDQTPAEYLKRCCEAGHGAGKRVVKVKVDDAEEGLARIQAHWPEVLFVGDDGLDTCNAALSQALSWLAWEAKERRGSVDHYLAAEAKAKAELESCAAKLKETRDRGLAIIEILAERQSGVRP